MTGITTGANAALKEYLGLSTDDALVDRVQQLAQPSGALLERLHVDSRYLYLKASRDWQDIELPDDIYQDEFGIRRKAAYGPSGQLLYYDFVGHPLSGIETVADLAKFKWPDPHDPARYAGLQDDARQLYEDTNHAVIVNVIGSLFEFAWYLRGFVPFMQDLVLDPDFAGAQLDAMLEYQMALMGEVLSRVGKFVSVVMTGSDLGTQRAPMIFRTRLPLGDLAALPEVLGLHQKPDRRQDFLPYLRQCDSPDPLADRGGRGRYSPRTASRGGHGRPTFPQARIRGPDHLLGRF